MRTKLFSMLLTVAIAFAALPTDAVFATITNDPVITDTLEDDDTFDSDDEDDTTEEVIPLGKDGNEIGLQSGVKYTGVMEDELDPKHFQFTVPDRPGYETFQFGYTTTKDCLSMYIYQKNKNGSWRKVFNQSDWWSGENEAYRDNRAHAKLTLKPGVYYIRLLPLTFCKNDTFFVTYTFTDDTSYEKESNDTHTKANQVSLNKTYHGNNDRYAYEDTFDYYKFTIPYDGYMNLHFTETDNATHEVRIFDKNLKAIYRQEKYDIPSSGIDADIPCKKGTYYLQITACLGANYYEPYEFELTATKTANTEHERNDTYQAANTLKLWTGYTGSLLFEDDTCDWYKFQTQTKGKTNIQFDRHASGLFHTKYNYGDGWKISIYEKPTKKPVKTFRTKDSDTFSIDLKKGTYYLKIQSYGKNKPIGVAYGIFVQNGEPIKAPKSVKLTSIIGGKKKATIKWSKSTDASGYYIYRATSKSGTYKKIATITKKTTVKYTDKKALKSKKTYYYKIVAYKKISGLTAASSASKIKGVKIK